MKKYILIVLALGIALGLAACRRESVSPGAAEASTAVDDTAVESLPDEEREAVTAAATEATEKAPGVAKKKPTTAAETEPDSTEEAAAKATEATEPAVSEAWQKTVASLVKVSARSNFTFRMDVSNQTGGEASPIAADYYLSAYKVTNAEYKKFTDATAHKVPSYWKNGSYPSEKGNHPVVNVSYGDACAYCKWLSEQIPGWSFRLPTEAEWENAAMGTYYGNSKIKYPDGGSGPAYDGANCTLKTAFNYNGVIASALLKKYGANYTVNYIKGDYAGTSEALGEAITVSATGGVSNWANHGGSATKGYFLQTDLYAQVSADGGNTSAVGAYPANSLGLYDMAGNCWDLTSSKITAANGLEAGVLCYAVRGGSWYATARSCTFYYRGEGRKDSPSATVGFRVAAERE